VARVCFFVCYLRRVCNSKRARSLEMCILALAFLGVLRASFHTLTPISVVHLSPREMVHRKKPFSGMDVETHRTAVCVQGVRPPLDKKLAPADLVTLLQVHAEKSLYVTFRARHIRFASFRFFSRYFASTCKLAFDLR